MCVISITIGRRFRWCVDFSVLLFDFRSVFFDASLRVEERLLDESGIGLLHVWETLDAEVLHDLFDLLMLVFYVFWQICVFVRDYGLCCRIFGLFTSMLWPSCMPQVRMHVQKHDFFDFASIVDDTAGPNKLHTEHVFGIHGKQILEGLVHFLFAGPFVPRTQTDA